MSKLSYQLSIKKYQRELELDDRKFNALDFKHNDINLLKQLQILNPVIVAPVAPVASASAPAPSNTGFYGTIAVKNITAPGGPAVSFQVKLAFNNEDITSYETINGGQTVTITVPIEDRLPSAESLLQYKAIFGSTSISVNGFEDIIGFTAVSSTNNPLDQENTVELLIDPGYIDGGALIQDVTIDAS
jgi:hypothetical protein